MRSSMELLVRIDALERAELEASMLGVHEENDQDKP